MIVTLRRRRAALTLLLTSSLAACADAGDVSPGPVAAPSVSTSGAPVAPSPTPTPSAAFDFRSAKDLGSQLVFTGPEESDPVVQEALDADEDFLRELLVAQGTSNPDYAPLLTKITPEVAEKGGLRSIRNNQAAGAINLGPWVEKVQEAAGSGITVYLSRCADDGERKIHRLDTGELREDPQLPVVAVAVTLTKVADRWLVSNYGRNKGLTCA